MKKHIAIGLALAACLTMASTSAADVVKGFTGHWYTDAGSGATLPFRLLTPPGYDEDPDREYPLVLFLHGAGESGTNNTSQVNGNINNLITHINTDEYVAFILAPQTDSGWWYSDDPSNSSHMTMSVVDLLLDYFRIDSTRLYVTGLSMGGYGTWNIIGERPNYFAAAVPVCGGGDPSMAVNMVNQPIWAFHARNDGTVPVERTREMIDAVRAVGGNPLYTEYSSGGHGIWGKAYNTDALYDWMFSQVLPPGGPPTAVADSYSLDEDEMLVVDPSEGVLSNDSEPDNDPLTAVRYSYSQPAHGTLSLDDNGSFDYTPEENYFGTDGFTYQAYDGALYSPLTTVALEIASVNDVPVAVADSYSVDEGEQLLVYAYEGVLVNDDDVETPEEILAVLDSDVSHGTLSLNNTGWFNYLPDEGFFGQDSFTYLAFDGDDYSEPTSVLIHVLSALKAPGDANRDGRVDAQDAATLAQYWGQTSATWAMGDFDGDQIIGPGDAAIMAANWGYVAGEATASVPEPPTMSLLVLGLLAMLRGRALGRCRRQS